MFDVLWIVMFVKLVISQIKRVVRTQSLHVSANPELFNLCTADILRSVYIYIYIYIYICLR